MKRTAVLILLPFLISVVGISDTLWEEDFAGFLSESSLLNEGQVVQVILDESTSFTYSSSSIGNKQIFLEFSGGEAGDLFAFLPSGRTGESLSRKGSEEYSIQTSIAARVIEIDEAGMALIRGERTIVFQNGEERVAVEGWINPGGLDESFAVPFSALADSRLSFSSFLDPTGETIRENELIETTQTELEPETEEALIEGLEEGELPLPEVPPAAGFELTDERKKELLLSYINRFLDIIFQLEE
jgi:hypothetical protein